MYVCVCVCIHIYIYTHIHISIYTCIHIYMYDTQRDKRDMQRLIQIDQRRDRLTEIDTETYYGVATVSRMIKL